MSDIGQSKTTEDRAAAVDCDEWSYAEKRCLRDDSCGCAASQQAALNLFNDLPKFTPPLPQDELRLLAKLPTYDTTQAVDDVEEAACRRLERRGLVKVHRWKDDPIALRPTMYAGKVARA